MRPSPAVSRSALACFSGAMGFALLFFVQKRIATKRPRYALEASIMSVMAFVAGSIMFSGIFYSLGLFAGRPNKLLFLLEISLVQITH